MGNWIRPSTGPNQVQLVGHKQCCSVHFEPGAATNDQRLTSRIRPDEIRSKILSMNRIIEKKKNIAIAMFIGIPLVLGPCVMLIVMGAQPGYLSCNSRSEICPGATANQDCIQFYCCKDHDYEEMSQKMGGWNGPVTNADVPTLLNAGCYKMNAFNETLQKKAESTKDSDSEKTVAQVCQAEEPMYGCNCYYKAKGRSRRRVKQVCDALFIVGDSQDYDRYQQRVWMLIIGIVINVAYMLCFIGFLVYARSQARSEIECLFQDWTRKYGIQVHFRPSGKHSPAYLTLTLPAPPVQYAGVQSGPVVQVVTAMPMGQGAARVAYPTQVMGQPLQVSGQPQVAYAQVYPQPVIVANQPFSQPAVVVAK